MPQYITCERCGEEKDNGLFPVKLTQGEKPRSMYIRICYECQGKYWNPVITKELGCHLYG